MVEEGVHHQTGARTQRRDARTAEPAAAAWHTLLITIQRSSCSWKLFQQLAGVSVGGTERKDKGGDPTSVLGPSMVARCSPTARIFLKARSVLFQQIHQFNEASEGMRVVSAATLGVDVSRIERISAATDMAKNKVPRRDELLFQA